MILRNSKPKWLDIPGTHMIGTKSIFHLGSARSELDYLSMVKNMVNL